MMMMVVTGQGSLSLKRAFRQKPFKAENCHNHESSLNSQSFQAKKYLSSDEILKLALSATQKKVITTEQGYVMPFQCL